MTEQEAIEELKCYKAQSGTAYPEEIELAINALEEVQQYRAIGTVEECRAAVEKQKEIRNKAIDDFEEKLLENAPKNYAGTLELGGMSCYLSANKVKQIAEKLKGGGVNE